MPDRLRDFASWYLAEPRWPIAMPADSLRVLDGWSELILYRDGDYQVELVTVKPDYVIPPHRHPHIASYEYQVVGDSTVHIGGRPLPSVPREGAGIRRCCSLPRNMLHGGVTPTGGVFLTLQRFHGLAPTFASDDWLPG
jgi:hypothetical protein